MMIVLLAFLPLQAWAGVGTSAAGLDMVNAPHTTMAASSADDAQLLATPASHDDSIPDSGPGNPADTAEPTPPGADFAEQLLPAPLPRVVTSAARGTVPRYAAAPLPDPDLPLLPRPPRG